MQEVWRCEGKKVFLQTNSVKRLKGEDYNHGKTKSARIQKRNVFSTDKNEM